jgi:hypothetical protein
MRWLRRWLQQAKVRDAQPTAPQVIRETGDVVRFDAWLDGELPAEEAEELERLLDEDPGARETLFRVRQRNALVSRTSAFWSDVDAGAPNSMQGRFGMRGDEAAEPEPREVVVSEMRSPVRGAEERAGSGGARSLGRLLERRAEANRQFERAREAEAGGRPADALAAVDRIFDLSDPRGLLGAPRLAELMDLAARCHAAQAAEREAADWRRRADALRREG